MKKTTRPARLFVLLLLLSLLSPCALATDSIVYTDLNGVRWEYAVDGTASLQLISDSNQVIENTAVLLISDTVNGIPVTTIESNGFDNVVTGHKANRFLLLPAGIVSVGAKAFYDFNFVEAVSFPSDIQSIDTNALDVLGREINNSTVIYGGKTPPPGLRITAPRFTNAGNLKTRISRSLPAKAVSFTPPAAITRRKS